MNEKVYVAKIEQMVEQLRQYRKENPTTELLIKFNAPKKVMVCAVISDAISQGFLSVSPAAQEMFDRLGWIKEGISYLMLQVTIEHEHTTADGEDQETKASPRF